VKSSDAHNRREGVTTADQLVTTRELMALLRLSRVGVWRLANKKDAQFPRAIVLGPKQKRWVRREVDVWLSARPRSAT
jgi:predicted DNA-binding transcriptional regulator AlpA